MKEDPEAWTSLLALPNYANGREPHIIDREMDDHPSRHSDEVKAFAIACRLAGDSYPTIQRKLSETLNESASLSTNWQWCQQSPATEGEHTARQLQMIAQQLLEIALKAGTLVEKR